MPRPDLYYGTMTTSHVDNILATFNLATDDETHAGLNWYAAANALAKNLDFHFHRAAGVIAALSPRLRWDKNVEYAKLAYSLKGYEVTPELLSYIPVLNNSRIKAMAMVNGAEPADTLGKGLKTNAFWDNIVNPYTSQRVTVDKHAFDIANGVRTPYSTVIKDKDYREIEAAYVEAANLVGIAPLQMQAITWVTWRNRKGIAE